MADQDEPPAIAEDLHEVIFRAIDFATVESSGRRIIDTDAFMAAIDEDSYQIVRKP